MNKANDIKFDDLFQTNGFAKYKNDASWILGCISNFSWVEYIWIKDNYNIKYLNRLRVKLFITSLKFYLKCFYVLFMFISWFAPMLIVGIIARNTDLIEEDKLIYYFLFSIILSYPIIMLFNKFTKPERFFDRQKIKINELKTQIKTSKVIIDWLRINRPFGLS